MNHVPSSVKVLGLKVPQNLHLVLRLLFKLGALPHHLDGDILGLLVVESLEDLGERTFAQETDQLVPEKLSSDSLSLDRFGTSFLPFARTEGGGLKIWKQYISKRGFPYL